MSLLAPIDAIIDRITMYRLMIYYLVFLLLSAMALSVFGNLNFSWESILISTTITVTACWTFNKIFGWIFNAPLNNESSLITAGILALIISPDMSTLGIAFLLAASGLAIASKYLIAINRKHIFNPAAIAVLITGIAANQTPTWWVGSAAMLPLVLVGGLIVMRKLRRTLMVLTFLAVTATVTVGFTLLAGGDPLVALRDMVFSSAVFFLAFVMLTEPLTAPVARGKQLLYAALVGALVPPQVHLFNLYTSPELALVIGNFFSFLDSPKVKLFPKLKQKLQVAANTADFVFTPDRSFAYEPGQYIEMTLQHANKDDRGERRYFTLASSPTEPDIHIGAKFYEPSSSYKKAMLAMTGDTPVVIGQLAGDFTLPKNPQQKLAFIAGGIGITPFRSMAKYLVDMKQPRDVTLLYSARTQQDVAYAPVFEEARRAIGMKTWYVLDADKSASKRPFTVTGQCISADLIARQIPDYHERMFYISGTHQMVRDVRQRLLELGVSRRHIKIDFFPGYA